MQEWEWTRMGVVVKLLAERVGVGTAWEVEKEARK